MLPRHGSRLPPGVPARNRTGGRMPPPGGLADKIGNRSEGRIAIWRILLLLDEQHDSVRVRFEKPGDDKFEWWVQRGDGSRTYTQVKRQQLSLIHISEPTRLG